MPVLSIRTVLIPPVRAPLTQAVQPWDDATSHDESGVQVVTIFGGALPEWSAALHAHPEVRVFMTAASEA